MSYMSALDVDRRNDAVYSDPMTNAIKDIAIDANGLIEHNFIRKIAPIEPLSRYYAKPVEEVLLVIRAKLNEIIRHVNKNIETLDESL